MFSKKLRTYNLTPKAGFAALLAIVIIGAAALIMAYNSSLLGLGELESGYTSQQGAEAFAIADGCLEEALRRLRITPTLSGTITPSVSGGGSCSVTIQQSVTSSGGSCAAFVAGTSIGVTATGCTAGSCPSASGYTKKACAELIIANPLPEQNAITIIRWQEIP